MEIALLPAQTVLFPGALMPVRVSEGAQYEVIRRSLDREEAFGVVLYDPSEGGGATLSEIGTLALIQQHVVRDDGTIEAIAVGSDRFRISRILRDAPYLLAEVEIALDEPLDRGVPQVEQALSRLSERFRRYASLALPLPVGAGEIQLPPGVVERVNLICSALLIPLQQKQVLLEESSLMRRLTVATAILQRETLELDALRTALRILRDEVPDPGPYPFSRN